MEPSETFVVRRPKDEVAKVVRAEPPFEPTRPYEKEVAPVPPRAIVSVPVVSEIAMPRVEVATRA